MKASGTWCGPVIEDGIPLSSPKLVNRDVIEAMREMKPGQSIRLEHMTRHAVYALARRIWGAGKYTVRTELGGHRIWRGRFIEGKWS